MTGDRARVRLRQAVLVAEDLERVAGELAAGLSLREPFRDPGVGEFGLANAVFAIDDCFLEVIAPTRPDTAAGRHMARMGGDCGYMLIFDLQDLDAARERAAALGVRVVWQIDLPDISGTHLHPADMRGAIVSIDRSEPFGTWRWGGPLWTGAVDAGAPVRMTGVTVAVGDPHAVSARWAHVLGVEVSGGERPALELDGSRVCFVQAAQDQEPEPGLVEVDLQLDPHVREGRELIEVAGVRFRLSDAPREPAAAHDTATV